MEVLKIVLLVLDLISAVVLTVIIMLQSGKEGGLGALSGNSENYMGKGMGASLDAKLSRITKWIGAAFILLTLFTALVYGA